MRATCGPGPEAAEADLDPVGIVSCVRRQGLATHYIQSFVSKAAFRESVSVYFLDLTDTASDQHPKGVVKRKKIHGLRTGPTTGRKEFQTGKAHAEC
jgi:hypothetical protein